MPVANAPVDRMTYRLRGDQPEPMSRRALLRVRAWDEHDPDEFHMTSSAMERLNNYMDRYCRGDIDGFSVLLAGQRGAGKTTLAKMLIQNAILTSTELIPLPIFLHGPTIIDPKANTKEDDEKKNEAGLNASVIHIHNNASRPRLRPKAEPQTDVYVRAREAKEIALPKLISSLYLHLSDAICAAWRSAAEHSLSGNRSVQEALEMAAHLDRLLEVAPGVEPLRKVWARAGFLQNGVAFYLRKPRPNAGPLSHVRAPAIAGHADDQGLREIVALAACADAFRGVIGKSKETWRSSRRSEQRRQQGLPPLADGEAKAKEAKDGEKRKEETAGKLGPPLLGVATSGIAALTAKDHSTATAVISGLLGVVVWTISWFALNYGVRRQSKQGLERESTTEIDWTKVRVLERRFPALIRRVKDAGFAPIFVLDELDKIDDAMQKLDDFLRSTKHIVTDEAAFFFLVNRDYYERVERLDRP